MKRSIFFYICFLLINNIFAQINVSIVADPYIVCCKGKPSVLTAIVSGGTKPYSYLWSTGATTSSITVYYSNFAYEYSVTVSDQNSVSDSAETSLGLGCVVVDSIKVINKGDSATLYSSGYIHTPPCTFLWSTWQCTPSITVSSKITSTYCVTVMDVSGCWDSACVSVGSGSINENSNNYSISVFPNPATDNITLESKSDIQQYFLVKIENIQGQQFFSDYIHFCKTYSIDLSKFSNGIYLLTLQNDRTYYRFKKIIQKLSY